MYSAVVRSVCAAGTVTPELISRILVTPNRQTDTIYSRLKVADGVSKKD
jgi:hypothetical protein